MSVQDRNETFWQLGCCLSWPSASCQRLQVPPLDLLTPDWGAAAAPATKASQAFAVLVCSLLWLCGCVGCCESVLMLRQESHVTAVLFAVVYLFWLKKLKIINLNKYLLHNGSHVRCFTVLHKGQRKLWIYPVYLGRVPVWFMREMRRMRAARLKRSSITNTQETLLKCTERGPQNDSRVSQITWKTWPSGFVILAFKLLMKFICREHELLPH